MSSAEYSWPESNNPGAKELKPTLPFRPFVAHNGLLDEVWAALKTPEDKRKKEAQSLVLEQFKWSAPQLQPLYQQLARLKAERDLLEASIPKVLVTQTTTPSETRILPRGNWMDESGALLQPAVPEFLGRLDDPQRRATRLDLANWIVSKDNPLTARVFVNRLWRQFFGTGLTKSLDDLGSQGEWPKHPELLDWLASEFMTDWDMKRAIRTIVTSHTYRQSSLSNAELDARDPDNRLLARQSRYRVDAEIVRDIALATSGLLVEKFGGPSVKPKQPENYLAALNFPKRDYAASRGDELYRRSLYTHWQRTFLHPGLMTFDAPTREECTVNRVNSNTPLQSLVLLNDPNYTEAARSFAEMALAEGGRSVAAQIRWAFERAVSRPPSSEEMKVLLELHHRSRAEYLADPIAATRLLNIGESPANKRFGLSKLAAMTIVTRAILNLHETITRN